MHLGSAGWALPGGPAGSVLTPGGRPGHGPAVNGRAGRAGLLDGAGEPGPHGGPAPLFRPGPSVCRDPLPAPPDGVRLIPSMSRTGNCWGNAYVESFFGTLKRELCTFGAMRPVTRRGRRSLSISRGSIIGSDGTRRSAITPWPNMKCGRQSRNRGVHGIGGREIVF